MLIFLLDNVNKTIIQYSPLYPCLNPCISKVACITITVLYPSCSYNEMAASNDRLIRPVISLSHSKRKILCMLLLWQFEQHWLPLVFCQQTQCVLSNLGPAARLYRQPSRPCLYFHTTYNTCNQVHHLMSNVKKMD